MGFDARPPTAAELRRHEVDRSPRRCPPAQWASPPGWSTPPGRHADEDELSALSEVSARHGGIYASHIRERGDNFVDAVEEALNIARRAGLPAQLAHLAPRPYAPEGAFDQVLDMLSEARDRVGTADRHRHLPRPLGARRTCSTWPRPGVYEGPQRTRSSPGCADPETAEKCRDHFKRPTNFLLRLGGFDKFLPVHVQRPPRARRQVAGRHLAGVGARTGADRLRAGRRRRGGLPERADPPHLRPLGRPRQAAARPLLQRRERRRRDLPRPAPLKSLVANRSSFGYAPRFIREYAIERGLFTVEEAVRKMTSLPADSAQLDGRGRLQARQRRRLRRPRPRHPWQTTPPTTARRPTPPA